MTTAELTQQTQAAMVRSEFRKQDAVIADLREKCTGMTVAKDGYKTVKAARIEVKNLRCQVENLRKDLKADVIERGKIIDEEAARLKNLLIPIETALEKEEEAEEARKAAAARAKVEAEERQLQQRIDALTAINVTPDIKALKAMDEEFFEHYVRDLKVQAEYDRLKAKAASEEAARIAAEAESIRLAQIEAERIERERLAALHAEEMRKQAEELAIRERELQAERAKIEAERVAAEAIRLEALRIEKEARDKAEAERQAVIAAERAKLDAERAELARQQVEARRIQAEREAEAVRNEEIRLKRIQDEADDEAFRLWEIEQARLAAEEAKRIEALAPEIQLAELFGVRVRTYCEEWFGDRDNRAWFGFAESEIHAACARVVEHVRKS
jgi:hypothetical protein